jgi:predicted DNA-binding transcriptional regulator AlpA
MTVVEELKSKRGLMGAKDVAALLGVNKEVLYRKAKAGEGPHLRILGQVKFDPARIAAWLEERQVG